MSARLDPSWKVVASPSTPAIDRCVDVFRRPDGTFGFEEFRCDPEDMGARHTIDWMRQPNRAFDGTAPLDLMDTEPGAVAVRQVLNAIATGGVV